MEKWSLMMLLHDLPFHMWLLFVKVLLGRHIRLPISTFSHLSNIICEISQQVSHEFAGFREASLQILCVKSRKNLWQTYFKSADKENRIVTAQTIFTPLSLTRNHSASWEWPQSLLLLIWSIFWGTHLPHATATAATLDNYDQCISKAAAAYMINIFKDTPTTCYCYCWHQPLPIYMMLDILGAAPIVCYHCTDIWCRILRILRLLLLIRW